MHTAHSLPSPDPTLALTMAAVIHTASSLHPYSCPQSLNRLHPMSQSATNTQPHTHECIHTNTHAPSRQPLTGLPGSHIGSDVGEQRQR